MNDQLDQDTATSQAYVEWPPICLTDEFRQHAINYYLQDAEGKLNRKEGHSFPPDKLVAELTKWKNMTVEMFRETQDAIEIAAIQSDRDRKSRAFREFIKSRGERYRDCRFSNYDITCDEQQVVVDRLKDYAKDMLDNLRSGKSVVLFGPSGTGKDHLLVAMARHAILEYRRRVEWTSGSALRSLLRQSMSEFSDETEASIVSSLVAADVLLISDPSVGGASLTDYQSDVFYRIIDERYNERKPIWVTVNCSNRAEMNAAIGVSIADRLVDGALTIGCEWTSHRKPSRESHANQCRQK